MISMTLESLPTDVRSTDRILIVGGRTTNFPESLRRLDQLIFWNSTDPETERKSKIPEGVKLIIITRFVSHTLLTRIRGLASEGVRILHHQSTGRIKEVLRSLGISKENAMTKRRHREEEEHAEEIRPRMTEKKAKRERGWLEKFVRQHADFSAESGIREIERLYTKIIMEFEDGDITTERSVGSCFYRLRKEAAPRRAVPRTDVRVLVGHPIDLPGVPEAAPAFVGATIREPVALAETAETAHGLAEAQLAPQSGERVGDLTAESESHLREFIKLLHELASRSDTSAVAFEEILEDRKRLLEENKRLKKLEEEIDLFRKTLRPFMKNGLNE